MKLYKNLPAIIVIPNNPLPTEQFAAEELAAYLKKSIGLTATITTAPEAGKYTFIIGCPSRNAAASAVISGEDFAKTVPGPEGIYINIGDDWYECANNAFIKTQEINDEDVELDRLIIAQNNDGIDTENRIAKFKKYI